MTDTSKTKTDLIEELAAMRRRVAELEQSETEGRRAAEALQRSEEAARRLAREDSVRAEIGRIISSTPNIEKVYRPFSEKVKELIPFDRITMTLVNLEENTHTIPYVEGVYVSGRQPGDLVPLAG